ncbi:D-alanyl-D-alanine carboxypeptidase family protein [Deinococcus roseus]|uniref:Peptidase M15B domain-containing protein n=1 Tax=Deinococcus roseus TaxID=392414 RepID=A0ABQ2CVE2_9DEIO|nr:D-alanyl-D-alanine carboxypeptidase family protein [Deinococcus roseus]GGJ24646.1 hypothetical protein GCM10008938_08430 [Deinococcus roseus]
MKAQKVSSLETLHPDFRENLERWLQAAQQKFPQYEFRVLETRRNKTRQKKLFSENSTQHWVTSFDGSRLRSMHQYGLAADIGILNRKTRKSVWDSRVWRTIYAYIPPSVHGLEVGVQELTHLQLQGAGAQYRDGELQAKYIEKLGLTLS